MPGPQIIDLTARCPHCDMSQIIARAFAGAGQTYVPDRRVDCACGCVYIASGAIVSGSALPVAVWEVPRDADGNLLIPPRG